MDFAPERLLFRAEQVRALDAHAIDTLGVPGYVLMERAARAALDVLKQRWPQARRLTVLCGPGNNGGDGFLLAAQARSEGMQVCVHALGESSRGDAARARAACADAGVPIAPLPEQGLQDTDVCVDALFGTGLTRPLADEAARWAEAINDCAAPVLALDIPSGLQADTGLAMTPAVQAQATVSFVAWKRGLFTHQGPDHCGALRLDRLGLPDALYATQLADAVLMTPTALPARKRAAHKGHYGHVLAVGGEHGMAGAVRLCAEAALRTGAGLVSVATRADHLGALNAARPELMARAVEDADALAAALAPATVCAIGPGLGRDDWGHAMWRALRDIELPRVIDADALNLLAADPMPFDGQVVLTPHPGEAGRLLGTDHGDVQADRFAAARALAGRYRAVVVLKGSGTLVATPDGRVQLCPWGNPGMASGGMGDALTGIIAALMAQGLDAWQAACLGVQWHARAGDRAARAGERGLLAGDLIEAVRGVANGIGDD